MTIPLSRALGRKLLLALLPVLLLALAALTPRRCTC